MRTIVLSLLFLALGGCGFPAASHLNNVPVHTVLEANGSVSVYDKGIFGKYVYHGYADYSFWVDAAVRNDAFHKTVTLRWTGDDWATQKIESLTYEGTLTGQFEKWGVDVRLGTATSFPYPEIRYVVGVEQNGIVTETKEMRLLRGVSFQKPVRVERSSLTVDAAGRTTLEGSIATFPFPGMLSDVEILYSTDGWATTSTLPTTLSGDTSHAFSIVFPGTPDRIAFVARRRASGQEFFDNNDGWNYSYTVASDMGIRSTQVEAATVLGGYADLLCSLTTSLTVSRMEMRLDEGPWTTTDRMSLPLWKLPDGTHRVQCRATLNGGYTRSVERRLDVSNRISTLDFSVMPHLPPQSEYESTELGWALAVDGKGRIVTVSGAGRVARFASYAPILATPEVFEAPHADMPRLGIQGVAATADGAVFAVGSRWDEAHVIKWTADGKLDQTFGMAGVLTLPTVEDSSFCAANRIAANESHLYIEDACGGRLVRLTQEGKVDGVLVLPPTPGTDREQISGLSLAGNTLWVMGRDRIFGIDVRGEMKISKSLLVKDVSLGNVVGLVHSAGKFFLVSNSPAALHVLNDQGHLEASWFSPEFQSSAPGSDLVPGAFDIPAGPALLPDGSLLVSSVQTPKLVRFSPSFIPVSSLADQRRAP